MQAAVYYPTPWQALAHFPWSTAPEESSVAKLYKSKLIREGPAVSLKEGVYSISQKGSSPD